MDMNYHVKPQVVEGTIDGYRARWHMKNVERLSDIGPIGNLESPLYATRFLAKMQETPSPYYELGTCHVERNHIKGRFGDHIDQPITLH